MSRKARPVDEDSRPPRAGQRRWEQQELDGAITALVAGGLTDNRAIAGQLGISPQSVRRHRRRLSLINPPRVARLASASREAGAPDLGAAIRRLLRDGLSKREVAHRLNISEKTVYQHLRAEGPSSSTARKPSAKPDHAYPEALLREVPPDHTVILPAIYFMALLRAAARCNTPAARESLRQALLLHEF